jgi:molybdate transport system permease protein
MITPDLFPVRLSLAVAGSALMLVLPLGLVLAWLQAHRRLRFGTAIDALILLPLVLPPSVVGYLLVVLLGREGPAGHALESLLGVRLIFTPAAAVLAAAIVALPLLVKTVQPAIEAVPTELEDVGRTLGLSPLALFFRVTLPASWRGMLAGAVLAFARALGEFGATLMFAGDIPKRTETMPLAIYAAYQVGDDRAAIFYVAVLVALSLLVVLLAARLSPRGLRT